MKLLKYLLVIPARCGSKGIFLKNITDLNNKPLIHYTLNIAKSLDKENLVDRIYISTDCIEIANENTVSEPRCRIRTNLNLNLINSFSRNYNYHFPTVILLNRGSFYFTNIIFYKYSFAYKTEKPDFWGVGKYNFYLCRRKHNCSIQISVCFVEKYKKAVDALFVLQSFFSY